MSFTLDVKAFCEKAKKNPEVVMRQVSMKLFSAIILGSPVATGRFRNNWFAGGATPSRETTTYTGKQGTAAIARVSKVITEARGYGWTELTLTNNLPYAQRLEYGWSKQAPVGMVRVNVARFNTLLNEEAAKVR
ncbi:HK97 gp10 family phage protein [Salmonella enterica subsp. enterica serovar Montevideo]|nr:HK97 gp10 family phage protein [Salmonella enterica subsp. enterica serovar Montevideo]EEO3278629.1 HK97 gp10 family phage protein [Salmonella enterica subsp. enterica serovar Rubislaw]